MMQRSLAFFLLFCAVWAAGCDSTNKETGRSWTEEFTHGFWVGAPCCPELRTAPSSGQDELLPIADFVTIKDGWGGPEDWGAWGLGEATRIHFAVDQPETHRLTLRAWAPPGLGTEDGSQSIEVFVNGNSGGSFSVGPDRSTLSYVLDKSFLVSGANELELRYEARLDGIPGQDDRPLALAFDHLSIAPLGQEPLPLPAGASRIGYRVNTEQDAVRISASGTSMVPVHIPQDAEALLFELEKPEDGGEFQIEALHLDGHREVLWQSADSGKKARIPLQTLRGRSVALLLHTELPEKASLTLWRPQLIVDADAASEAQPSPPPQEKAPHVILIVLDAARADHFSYAGYERETTPEIDAFADEALVFSNATSECPYTMCSMPNMLTGLNLLQHGLIARGLTLSPEAETLAERLAQRGYQTVGLTSNPNNSTITGADQGMQVYREIWETHPRYLHDAFTAMLEDGTVDPQKPLFLMMHYVPPHEPYDPDPEHDLFGDPDYSGFVTSDREQTRDIYAGKIELGPEDLAELVALYDGNLHMADAWVGKLIDVLRENDLWDEALVVLTSDHGEAFAEHQDIGHNTTLYDGMLQVPFVLKPPASFGTPEIDARRLVSVGDFLPTVLARLGELPSEDVGTVDLLAPVPADRLVVLRSAQAIDPVWGIRTRRYKALSRVSTGPELYDLQKDPGEKRNLAAENPLLHAALIGFLERERRAPAPLLAGVRDGEISERDAEMLRNLGYLGN